MWKHLYYSLQATQCSFSGKLESDPESTVYISGCPGKESMDISLMSKKVAALVIDLTLVITNPQNHDFSPEQVAVQHLQSGKIR